MTFKEKVLAIVKTIKRGEVRTYGSVAKQAGNAKAARAVGNIMSKNYDKAIPCHRVVRADGSVGGYNRGGSVEKEKRLNDEKVLK